MTTTQQKYESKAKERREELKAISKQVRGLVEAGEFSHVNEAIIEAVYKDETNNRFKTFQEWKKEGFNIKKGSRSFVVWGSPRTFTPSEPAPEEEEQEEKEFFPICYLFSNAQVEPGRVQEPAAAYEIGIVYKTKIAERKKITGSSAAAEIFRGIIGDNIEHKELFYTMLTNRSGHVITCYKVSEGGTAGTVVDIKHILQAAILSNSSGIIACHNHPSGNLKPSDADLRITNRLKLAAELMDINLTDHIILTPESYYSFADNGNL